MAADGWHFGWWAMKTDPNEPFLPLSATPLPDGRRPDLRVTVLKPADTPLPFEPFPSPGPASVARPNPPAAAARSAAAACEPRVTVEREGDFVSAIRVQCTCGQTIELACVYESRGAKA
jgi:hypothetical protein